MSKRGSPEKIARLDVLKFSDVCVSSARAPRAILGSCSRSKYGLPIWIAFGSLYPVHAAKGRRPSSATAKLKAHTLNPQSP